MAEVVSPDHLEEVQTRIARKGLREGRMFLAFKRLAGHMPRGKSAQGRVPDCCAWTWELILRHFTDCLGLPCERRYHEPERACDIKHRKEER